MRVLLTGAAGFLGSRAAKHLLDGDEVHAVVRPGSSRARLAALAPAAQVHEIELGDATAVKGLAADVRPELAVHLAWYAVPGRYLVAPENLDHVEVTLTLARALAAQGCKRLVTAGTCFEYDTSFGFLSERTPTAPRFLYSACKLAVFEILREACRGWSMSFSHLRFFYQYGPWEAPGRLVPAILDALARGEEAKTTSGSQIRDFLHVDDVGRAIAAAARSDLEGAVNVGSGVPISVRDVVVATARAFGREDLLRLGALPQREGDPPFVCADSARLRSTGWEPRLSLQEGLADTVAWHRRERA